MALESQMSKEAGPSGPKGCARDLGSLTGHTLCPPQVSSSRMRHLQLGQDEAHPLSKLRAPRVQERPVLSLDPGLGLQRLCHYEKGIYARGETWLVHGHTVIQWQSSYFGRD